MKKLFTMLTAIALILMSLISINVKASIGWPASYGGVMLQGFYWDSYDASQWSKLESQADEFAQYFDLIWIPQSARATSTTSMGYDDLYWFTNYTSSFGNEQQLRSMISTFKQKGIGTIADVVINHRGNVSNWVDFPAETYNGVTYQLQSTDIVANDDNGETKTWADANGYSLSSNNDTGEGWDGMRDLDHKSTNVQTCVKAYLDMLLNDFGYTGFRYDMVKGYAGSFTGMYNDHANPQFSVGEYWDGNAATVKTWINATKVNDVIQSAAFDFPFRYTVRDAINNSNWTKLANASVMSDEQYRQYAVTFVENHDTEYRSSTAQQDPILKDTLAANAFMLAMPGTPCVFFKHWIDCKQDIKAMIDARKAAGITNTSSYNQLASATGYYAVYTEGTKGQLMALVGNNISAYTPGAKWVKILSGYHYAYYLAKANETAWIDKASGEYSAPFDATITAVSSTSGAKLVYTLDGSTPTANSTQVESGTKINISTDCTLTVGLLINGTVTGIVSRTYSFSSFQPYTITVYVNVDQVGWSNVNFWTWGGDGTHAPTNTSWPGDQVTATTTVNGKTWYYKTYTINSQDDYVSFVFSTNSGSPQTVDYTYVTKDQYLEISADTDNGKNKINDVTTTTAINNINAAETRQNEWYNINGIRINRPTSKGIYIHNGKKIVIR